MRKRKANRALVVALSVAMVSSNLTPAITTYAEEPAAVQEQQAEAVTQEQTDTEAAETTEAAEAQQEAGIESEFVTEDTEALITTTESGEEQDVTGSEDGLEISQEDVSEEAKPEIESTTMLEYESEDGTYTLKYQFRDVGDTKEAVIKKFGSKKADAIEIPAFVSAPDTYSNYEEYQNIPVTAIDQNAFTLYDAQGSADLSNCPVSVTIPETVESIGTNAFASGNTPSTRLQKVIFEGDSRLMEIGDFAFQNQAGLESEITIPEGVVQIGEQAFFGCAKVKSFTFHGGSIIGAKAFSGCKNAAGGITLPETTIEIGGEAFLNYGSSTDGGALSLPEGLESIGAKAFSNAKLVGNLTIPSTVTTIGANAFISAYISQKDKGTLTFALGEDGKSQLQEIPAYAFNKCIGLSGNVNIPNSVTKIGDYAFAECSSLDGSLTLSDSLVTIGTAAFNKCSSLIGDVKIPDSVTSLGATAFKDCESLDGTLKLSVNLTKIPVDAFNGCVKLHGSVEIPDGVTSIETNAFRDCEGLDGTLTLPGTVKTIKAYAFANCKGLKGALEIPELVTIVSNEAFLNCESFTSLTMPDGIRDIQKEAFSGCIGLTSELVLPASLKTVGDSAFYGCNGMTGNLDMPDTVTSVGKAAFSGMTGLKGYLYLSKKLMTFGESCFNGCENLKNQKDETGKDIKIEIAEGTKTLPQFMFNGCENLTSIKLPRTITAINSGSFAKMNSGLNVYVYAGSGAAKVIRGLSASERTFNIEYIDMLESIKLTSNAYTMRVGSKRELKATLRYYKYDKETKTDVAVDVSEKDAPDKLIWTVPGKRATLEDGVLTGIAYGSESINVASPDGTAIASCRVTVVDKYVTSVKLDSTTLLSFDKTKEGQSAEIQAIVSLQGFKDALEHGDVKAEDLQVVFNQSTEGVLAFTPGEVTFNEGYTQAMVTTVVTPLKAGTSNISVNATVEGDAKKMTSSSRKAEVVNPLTAIKLPETASVKQGKTINLKNELQYVPEDAAAVNTTWTSSDTNVATVTSTGVVTGKKAGTTIITCTPKNGALDTAEPVQCVVTVIGNYVTAVELDDVAPVVLDKAKGDKITVTATVSLQGFAEALAAGTVKTGDLKFELKQSAVGVLNIEAGEVQFNEDYSKATLQAVVTPLKVGTSNLSASAIVTGDSGTATSEARKATVVIALDSIDMLSNLTLKSGKTFDMSKKLSFSPSDATTKKVTWESSDPDVAAVSSVGVITTKKAGHATITCTPVNGEYDTAKAVKCELTVVDQYVKAVKIGDTTKLVLDKADADKNVQINATVSLQGFAEAMTYNGMAKRDLKVSFVTSNQDIVNVKAGSIQFNSDYTEATVTATVKAAAVGSTDISVSATVSGDTETAKSESRTVEVISTLKEISIPKALTIKNGKTVNLSEYLEFTPEDATTKAVTWESKNPDIATISVDGVVTTLKAGTAEIVCTPATTGSLDTAQPVNCVITVVDQYITAVAWDDTAAITLNRANKKEQAEVSVTVDLQGIEDAITYKTEDISNLSIVVAAGADGIVTVKNGTVEFNSNYTQATMKAVITPDKDGAVDLTAAAKWTDGSEEKNTDRNKHVDVLCALSAIQIPQTASLKAGEKVDLAKDLKFTPADATTREVTWESSDKAIATVSQSGVVTAVKAGTVTITCTPKTGALDTAKAVSCKITVTPKSSMPVVKNVKAETAGRNKVRITWDKVANADGYIIYAKKAGVYGYCGMTTSNSITSYTDKKAQDAEYNFYWVYAYKNTAKGREVSPVGKYTYAKGTCVRVTDLKATSMKGGVKVSWSKTAGADGYIIYGKTSRGKYGYIGMTSKLTYTDTKAAIGEYNFYWVFAYHMSANGKRVIGPVSSKYVYGKAR